VSFVGYTDTQVYLIPPESDQPAHELGWVPRHAPEEKFLFTRGADGLFIPYDDAQALAEAEIKASAECRIAILELVPYEPEMIAFVAVIKRLEDKIGVKRRMAFYVRNVLIEEGLLLVPRRGCVSRPKVREGENTASDTG
jgi:hypothetical protein